MPSEPQRTLKPTKRMREFLEWAQVAGTHRIWPAEWSVMHRRARDAGFIERCRDDPKAVGLYAWRLSSAGTEALRAGQ